MLNQLEVLFSTEYNDSVSYELDSLHKQPDSIIPEFAWMD
jgi:hypothetical protein